MPEVGRSSKGKSIANLVNMAEGERMAALLRVQAFPDQEGQRFILMGTQKGTIKKTDLGASRIRGLPASLRFRSTTTIA